VLNRKGNRRTGEGNQGLQLILFDTKKATEFGAHSAVLDKNPAFEE